MIYHVPRRHMIYRDIIFFFSPCDIMSISCRVLDDTWTWYRHMIYWWYMMIYRQIQISYSTSSTLHDIEWYHMISSPPTTAQAPRPQTVISRYIILYHVISWNMISHDTSWYTYTSTPRWAQDIEWYMMIFDDIWRWLGSLASSQPTVAGTGYQIISCCAPRAWAAERSQRSQAHPWAPERSQRSQPHPPFGGLCNPCKGCNFRHRGGPSLRSPCSTYRSRYGEREQGVGQPLPCIDLLHTHIIRYHKISTSNISFHSISNHIISIISISYR